MSNDLLTAKVGRRELPALESLDLRGGLETLLISIPYVRISLPAKSTCVWRARRHAISISYGHSNNCTSHDVCPIGGHVVDVKTKITLADHHKRVEP
jgi:hypothetical protein